MSDEYTPETKHIRDAWVYGHEGFDGSVEMQKLGGEFDRWLALERAKAKAEVLRDTAGRMSRPANGAPYEVWTWCAEWLRAEGDCIEREAGIR